MLKSIFKFAQHPNIMEKRVPLEELLGQMARYFKLEFRPEKAWTDVDQLLINIEKRDTECHQRLSLTIEAWSLYDYIKKDRELKIKMSDVWEAEVIRLRHQYYQAYDRLVGVMKQHGMTMG